MPVVSFEPLLDQVENLTDDELVQLETSFEDVIGDSLPEYHQARKDQLVKDTDRDDFVRDGRSVRSATDEFFLLYREFY